MSRVSLSRFVSWYMRNSMEVNSMLHIQTFTTAHTWVAPSEYMRRHDRFTTFGTDLRLFC
jgi:hypothetical protein